MYFGELDFKRGIIKLKRILDANTKIYMGTFVRDEVFYYVMNQNNFMKNSIVTSNFEQILNVSNRGMIMTTAF